MVMRHAKATLGKQQNHGQELARSATSEERVSIKLGHNRRSEQRQVQKQGWIYKEQKETPLAP